ncbi:hypothetical protein Cgig2_032164 [Carnegiea gigantea]|uniref:Uncharacterized protein n=1 Tax=Carnegiea gigantea TaxID=171969 RepID=A0A9Q1GX31_9CARY|nr:hypothetical protein Cgig2_032164 [Carnegiea gigantea]
MLYWQFPVLDLIPKDFLNLFGCLLEPASLPTQFYMALLYTVTTLTLALQAIYYGRIYPRLKSNKQFQKATITDQIGRVGPYSQGGNNGGEKLINGSGQCRPPSDIFQSGITASSPIPLPATLPRCRSAEQDSYYRSARSLSSSHTPTRSSFVAPWRAHTSVDAEASVEEPLLAGSLPTKPAYPSKTKNLFCVVSAFTFLFGTMNISSTENSRRGLVLQVSNTTVPEYVHRKLLQVVMECQVNDKQPTTSTSGSYSGIGTYMGWGMAAIYVGGRLPQICLNIRRGNVEGLNLFMFIFALLGNTTYVASIMVNSLDWPKIRPNLPWLVDATGCALLDTFVSF